MPVVPYVRKEDSRGQGFSPARPREVPAADEPWLLMAAAQMDAQGRLVEPMPKAMIDEMPKIMIDRIEPKTTDVDEDEAEWGEPDLPTRREGSDLPTRKSR